MGGPFELIKQPTDKPPQGYESRGPIIHMISAQITITCTCGGNGAPIIIHLIPGLDSKPKCPACKTQYYLTELSMDTKNESRVNIQVGMIKPPIVIPH